MNCLFICVDYLYTYVHYNDCVYSSIDYWYNNGRTNDQDMCYQFSVSCWTTKIWKTFIPVSFGRETRSCYLAVTLTYGIIQRKSTLVTWMVNIGVSSSYSTTTAVAARWACVLVSATIAPMIWPWYITWNIHTLLIECVCVCECVYVSVRVELLRACMYIHLFYPSRYYLWRKIPYKQTFIEYVYVFIATRFCSNMFLHVQTFVTCTQTIYIYITRRYNWVQNWCIFGYSLILPYTHHQAMNQAYTLSSSGEIITFPLSRVGEKPKRKWEHLETCKQIIINNYCLGSSIGIRSVYWPLQTRCQWSSEANGLHR